ncbi:alkyl hydroperoxide reductase [Amycolatopsis rifamycinica]|uniref:Alkyl hydroperoxide reductase n=1 Tax=Amycolatopsis rifamycinica TaxID=287986 RepID=A0A066U4I4_9PSEU|nr:alkyl hydroperoxide reductase [Amycolatopsis rifamycinica]
MPRSVIPAVALLLTLSSCSTGKDAVVHGSTFEFVSPGGQTNIFYSIDQRRKIADLSGPSVVAPDRTISIGDYAGKVVLLNLWGAWCGPCRTETHVLREISTAGKREGLEVLGIDVRDNRQYAADFIRDFQVDYESIFDPSGRIALQLRGLPLAAVPISLIVDKRQRVAAVYIGAVLQEDVRPKLEQVRAEP